MGKVWQTVVAGKKIRIKQMLYSFIGGFCAYIQLHRCTYILPYVAENFLFLCKAYAVINVLYFNGSSNVSGSAETCILQQLAYTEKTVKGTRYPQQKEQLK